MGVGASTPTIVGNAPLHALVNDLPDDIVALIAAMLSRPDPNAYIRMASTCRALWSCQAVRAARKSYEERLYAKLAHCVELAHGIRQVRASITCNRPEWRTDQEFEANQVRDGELHLTLCGAELPRVYAPEVPGAAGVALNTFAAEKAEAISEVVSDRLVEKFVKASSTLACLTVGDVTDEDGNQLLPLLRAVSLSGSLRCLTLSGVDLVDTEKVLVGEVVCNSHTLKTVWLANCDITAAHLHCFAAIGGSSVQLLDLSLNPLTDDEDGAQGMQALSDGLVAQPSAGLELHMRDSDLTPTAVLALLPAVRAGGIQRLDLSNNRLGDASAHFIAQALMPPCNLAKLWLDENLFTPKGAESLAIGLRANKSLLHLSVAENRTLRGGILPIALAVRDGAGAPLEALDLADIDMTEGDKQAAAMVLRAKELQFLDLTRTQLGNSGSKMIADVLPHSPSINFLGLAENRIGKKGSIALAEALKWVVPLEELRLCGNDRLDRRVLSKALGGARCCVLSFDW